MKYCSGYAVCQFDTMGSKAMPVGKWDSNVGGKVIGNELEIKLSADNDICSIITFICTEGFGIGRPKFLHEAADKSFR